MRRYSGLLLLLWLLAGCNSQVAAPTGLRFGLQTAPVTLDPRYATDAASTRMIRLLYQPLIDFDAHSQPIAVLADWQQLSPMHYRFHLKPGNRFQNGEALTAKDVQQTYLSILHDRPQSAYRSQLMHITRITTPDNMTVDFFLSRQDNLFVSRLNLGIMPADLLARQHDFASRPVGSGKFRFKAWPDHNVLQLKRRSDGREFDFIEVKDPTVRVLKLLNGELDIIQNDITPELIAFLQREKGIDVRATHGSNFTYIGFNLQDKVTGSHRIRQALAMAIDRKAIIKYVLSNYARPAMSILVPEHWAGDPELPPIQYDPQRARNILHEMGYNSKHRLQLVYKTSSDPLRVRLATIIQSQLGDVGVDVVIKSHDWGTFYGDIKAGNFQMYSLSWVGIQSPDVFENVFDSKAVPPAGANRGRYMNPDVDGWIEQSQQVSSRAQQIVLYRKIQQTILRDLPYIPLWYEDHVVAKQKYVHGYRLALDGNYDSLQNVTWVN